jgi:hypothetical protein
MNLSTFRTKHPEFEKASDSLIQATLDSAEDMLDADIFGNQFDSAHEYLTAHLLALSPFGRNAKLTSKDGRSVYQDTWEMIKYSRTQGFRVT